MNTKRILVVAVAGLFAGSLASVAMAKGGNGQGGAGGQGNMTSSRTQVRTSTATVRPVDSQRRDGTFLTTGTTANGSTARPSNGNGLQDGSRLTVPPVQ
ncbi:MAG: hypothetical protein HGA96_11980 [Desulfobulbaceae bacterium]|nr:hypothetical protein [Desulfobulbaceae bacterium]